MTNRLYAAIQRLTGCSKEEAERAWFRSITTDTLRHAIIVSEYLTTSGDELSPVAHDTLAMALSVRKDRYNVPETFLCEPSPYTSENTHPLDIVEVVIVSHSGKIAMVKYVLGKDLDDVSRYGKVIPLNVCAKMLPVTAGASAWFFDEMTVMVPDRVVQWYDENHQFHTSPEGIGVGPRWHRYI